MASAGLFLLDRVLDVHVPVVTVTEVRLDAFALVAHDEDDVVDACLGDGSYHMFEERAIGDGDHRLGTEVSERLEATAFPRSENDSLRESVITLPSCPWYNLSPLDLLPFDSVRYGVG